MKKYIKYTFIVFFAGSLLSCTKTLDVVPYSELVPENVLTSEAGMRGLLFSSYAHMQTQQNSRFVINMSEVSTDIGFNTGGAENGVLLNFINFTWNSSTGAFAVDLWNPNYRSIRDANLVVAHINNVQASDAVKKLFLAEARVLRAHAYATLHKYFGPVPLRISPTQTGDQAKATEEEMRSFIETEIMESVADLPNPGAEATLGRMNKGIAYAILAKFFLNTKQWQKAADASQSVMNLNYYSLPTGIPFKDLFRVENEGNREMILVLPCLNQVEFGNWWQAGALPPGFKSSPQFPDFVYQSTMANFATQYRLRSAFVNTMAATDARRSLILTSYVNQNNATVNLMATPDNARSLKYWDNNTIGNHSGNDVPLIRYADILLTRAEALNELSTLPTIEAFNLINQVRTRANLGNLNLTNTPSKEAFRDAILRERGWEFISEGKRREDLIRHGKFLSSALARGVAPSNATESMLLFPIPQEEINANKAFQ